MSDRELSRLEVLWDLQDGRLTVAAAARLLGLERRQVFRLLRAYRADGPSGLISKHRGRTSNRRAPEEKRQAALAIIREHYSDFGPTLAGEPQLLHQTVLQGLVSPLDPALGLAEVGADQIDVERGVGDIDAANAFLPMFMAQHNARFASLQALRTVPQTPH
jgi:hypothetical protein